MDPKDNSEKITPDDKDNEQPLQQEKTEVSEPNGHQHEQQSTPNLQDGVKTIHKHRKRKLGKRIAIIAACVIIIPIVTILLYSHFRYAQMNQAVANIGAAPSDELALETEEPTSTNLPEANPSDIQGIINVTAPPVVATPPVNSNANEQTENVLLLGVDTRNPSTFSGRTDTIIIANIDPNKKTIKLISIMRDTLLEVPNHKNLNRINTVLEFGGPDAVMSTIQRYFGIKVNYYAIVNFWGVADIIDTLGGVNIDVQPDEIDILNGYLTEINSYSNGTASPLMSKSGTQKLTGKQAVAYMRIRCVGHGDYQRTDRQRTVLSGLAKTDRSLLEILDIVNRMPNYVRTNANEFQMASIAKMLYDLRQSPIQQLRIPVDNSYRGASYNGMSILIVNFNKNAEALQDFLSK
jgi:polyisoprenyl-teichoic acid--peptidoglycan teichoic acid transferase